MDEKITSMIRVRMSAKDAHYGGNLVDGAHMVHLFGDVVTETKVFSVLMITLNSLLQHMQVTILKQLAKSQRSETHQERCHLKLVR